ncbi:hypothetical protein TWF481_009812 [Arthrobotrys musiformis]|uniref:Uncharacterized protein n=1 Tax=Arthrobotrys musiformis TaxID=47236 RepID=A0AAV9W5W0_9PEZI
MAVDIRAREAVDAVINILSTKLPVELALDIVELAEYYPYTILGSRSGTDRASYDYYHGATPRVYLVVQIPFLNPNNEGNSGGSDIQHPAVEGQRGPGKRVVQKIIFRTTSHDQGWGGETGCRGTYNGVFSWLSAEIWRKKTENYRDDMKTALASQAKSVEANGGDINDEGTYHHWGLHHGYTKIGDEEDKDEIEEEYIEYAGYDEYEEGEEGEEPRLVGRTTLPPGDEGWIQKTIRAAKPDYYKVGCWVLQRNVCAKSENTDHEIVWDAAVDGPGPELEKWGNDEYKDENGRPMATGWVENGRVANSTFVKELREGDEVRVVMMAYFGGWSCTAEHCEVECWWAV